MSKKFLQTLYRWPKPYLTGVNLTFALDKSADSRQAIVKRAVQEGALIRLRRDLYLIKDQLPVDAFVLAQLVYGPSYISFESALQFHGWIPEAVVTTTSASTKKSTEFDTPLGFFSYRRIPIPAFPMGIGQHRREDSIAFIADPWKAIADMIYVQKKTWRSRNALCADMRIEKDTLAQSDFTLLEYLSNLYPNKRTTKVLKRLLRHGN